MSKLSYMKNKSKIWKTVKYASTNVNNYVRICDYICIPTVQRGKTNEGLSTNICF